MNSFVTMTSTELMEVEGGVIGWVIVGGLTLVGSFALGYGVAYWLG